MIDPELYQKFRMYSPVSSDEIRRIEQTGPTELEVLTDDDTKIIYDSRIPNGVYIEHPHTEKNPRSKEEWQKEFSRRLYRAMRLYGYTQTDLADELGVSPVVVSRWTSGTNLPRLDTTIRIAHILNFPVSKLVDFW